MANSPSGLPPLADPAIFRLLVESVTEYGILMLDPAGRVASWNPGAQRLKGYTGAEIIGQHFSKFYPEEAVSRGVPQRALQVALEHGHEEVEGLRLRKDGTTFWAISTVTALYDSDRKHIGFSYVSKDLTDMRRRDELLRSVLDNTIDGIISINDQGEIETFNRAAERLFGYRPDEVLGKNVSMLMAEHCRREYDQYISNNPQNAMGHEAVGQRKDGTTFGMELSVTEFQTQFDRRRHFVSLIRDITDRNRLENQLRQAQKMEAVGQLAGGVAHDFNNMLTIISGYSELMLDKLAPDDPMRTSLIAVKEAGDQAAALTKQLLAFSRQTVLEPKTIDLNGIVVDTEKMLRRLIGEDLLLTVVLDPNIKRVRVDPSGIGQVMMNLAVNARDAMPRGGRLTIETTNIELEEMYCRLHPEVQPGPHVLMTMTDTGEGMVPAIRARIFEPFFTTKAVGKGTGLGLAVAHGIVKQSGGHIEVYSEPGIGTTFKVYFPAIEEAAATAVLNPAPKPARGTDTILLVEDEAGVRGLALLALQGHGYRVLEAGNPAEAMQLLENHHEPIDLLATDVVMPGASGRELAAALRPRFPRMKVLYMSGYTDDAVVRHGLLQAEVSFLQKPYTPHSLLAKVRQVLDGV